MSMVICEKCDWDIDSDEDCDCFISIGKSDAMVVCESCREQMAEDGELDFETNTLIAKTEGATL